MNPILFDISALDPALLPGLSALSEDYGFALSEGEGLPLRARLWEEGRLTVTLEKAGAVICHHTKNAFFRGFSLLLEELRAGKGEAFLEEIPQFDENGAMFDVSQGNALLKVSAVKELLRRMAMMGLNLLMLYCEDSYTVEEEPYFGYMRGRYTEEELRECDDYADQFGIEMVPCIQTLGHLTDVLKWPAFSELREDHETLFVGGEKTYVFIEHLIRAASRPFRSKRIHIGMDEAWHLGRGRYLDEHGVVPVEDIMQRHLERVMEIVRGLGLEPMMWSDMFFRALCSDGGYYSADESRLRQVAARAPKDVSMVYWDYYHFDEAFYSRYINLHRAFGEPVFAGGIWTWTGFGPNWGMTFATTHPALESCKKLGVRRVFATIWGDHGTECNVWANLLGLSLFAEHGWARAFDEDKFRRRFEFCCGARYEDFYALRLLDEIPGCSEGNLKQCNASKYLLWQDPLMGLFDYHCKGLPLGEHYDKLAALFREASERNGRYNSLFRFYACLADALAIKAELGLRLTDAYRSGDREALRGLAGEELPRLLERVEALRRCHRQNWFRIHKAMGWDVMDMRYGSLLIRLRSAMEQTEEYLEGRLERLEELEEERRSFNGSEGPVSYANWYGRIVSASRIAPEA
ncbi:MAG: beta-N-acetylhexosaminidase [Oscillospiraceae bacterium]|nr:beta-N-acetylhexosaminidase [Oscillospiraceae bacterium]